MLKKNINNLFKNAIYKTWYKYFRSGIIYVQNWRVRELLKCILAIQKQLTNRPQVITNQTYHRGAFGTLETQALGYTLLFSLCSLKLDIFPFSASILTFSTQNHLLLTYFTHFDTTHCFYKYFNDYPLCSRPTRLVGISKS